MTTQLSSSTPHLPGRRSRLSVARDLLVVGLCTLVVGGFLFDVSRSSGAGRPAASASKLSS